MTPVGASSWLPSRTQDPRGLTGRNSPSHRRDRSRYLHQVDVLSAELVWGQVLPVDDPGVFEDLNCRQALLRVHVEHLGHDILRGRVSGAGAGVRAARAQSRPPPPCHGKTSPLSWE